MQNLEQVRGRELKQYENCLLCEEPTNSINGRVLSCCKNIIHNDCYMKSLGLADAGRCFLCKSTIKISDEEQAVEMLQRNVVQKKAKLDADHVELVSLLRNPHDRGNSTLSEFLDQFFIALRQRTQDTPLERWALWEECLSQVTNPASYAVRRDTGYYRREVDTWCQRHQQQLNAFLGVKPTSTISVNDLREALAKLEESTFSPSVKVQAWELFFQNYQRMENESVLTEFMHNNFERVLRLGNDGADRREVAVIVNPIGEELPKISSQELQTALSQLEALNLSRDETAQAWNDFLQPYQTNPQDRSVIINFLTTNSNRLQRLLFEADQPEPVVRNQARHVPAQVQGRQNLYIAMAVIALVMAYFFSNLHSQKS